MTQRGRRDRHRDATRSSSAVPVGIYPYTRSSPPTDRRCTSATGAAGSRVRPTSPTACFRSSSIRGPASRSAARCRCIDTASNTVVKTIDVGLHPTGMALSPRGDRAVRHQREQRHGVRDQHRHRHGRRRRCTSAAPAADGEPLLGSSPNAVTVSPNGRTLYVANASQNAVAVVDADAQRPRRCGARADSDRLVPDRGGAGRDGRAALHRQRLRIRIDCAPTPPGAGPQLHGSRRRGLDSGRARTAGSSPASPSRCATTTTCCRRSTTSGRRRRRRRSTIAMDDGRRHGSARPRSDSDARRPALADQARLLHHQGKPHLRSGVRRHAAGQRRSVAGASSGATSRRITTRWPSSSCCSTTTTVPATSPRSGIAGSCRRIPSTWVHKYGNARNNQSPMLLGPTDAIYDSAKAHGLSRAGVRRARREHDHAGERHLDRHLQRLEERHHQRQHRRAGDHRRPARRLSSEVSGGREPRAGSVPRGHLPEGVRRVREERQPAEPGAAPALRRPHRGHEPGLPDAARGGRRQRSGARPDRRGDLAEPVLEGVGDLRDRRRLAGRSRSRRRAPHGGPRDQPVRDATATSTATSTRSSTCIRTIEQILGLSPLNQFDLAAEPMFSAFTSKPDFTPYTARPNQIPLDEMNPPLARPDGPAARAGQVLADDRQLGAGFGASRPAEPRDLALGEGLRHAVQLRPADTAATDVVAVAVQARRILGTTHAHPYRKHTRRRGDARRNRRRVRRPTGDHRRRRRAAST